jgi:hypothetical protein
VIPFPNARPGRGNKFLDRVESSPVSLPRVVVWATLAEMQVSATAREALVARIAPLAPVVVPVEPIALAAVISRAVVQVTGMPSEVAPGDSMDPAHAATAIAAPPAWDLARAALIVAAEAFAVVVEAFAVVVGAVAVVVGAVEVAAVVAGKCCGS